MSARLCVTCRHFGFDPGEPAYSEVTPGTDASLTCEKSQFPWDLDEFERKGPAAKRGDYDVSTAMIHDLAQFRALIALAVDCPHYEEAKP